MNKYSEEDIQNYIMGELPEGERQAFENQLLTDSELKRRLELEEALVAGIQRKAKGDFALRVAALVEQRRRRTYWIYAIIALLALLAVGSVWFLNNGQEPKAEIDPAALFAQAYERPKIRTGLRGEENKSTLDVLRQLYDAKKYDQVMVFRDQGFTHPEAEDDLIFVVALMEKGKWAKAQIAVQAADKSDPVYGDHLEWFGALIDLRLGNVPACLKTLKMIAKESGHDHQQDALVLISHLE